LLFPGLAVKDPTENVVCASGEVWGHGILQPQASVVNLRLGFVRQALGWIRRFVRPTFARVADAVPVADAMHLVAWRLLVCTSASLGVRSVLRSSAPLGWVAAAVEEVVDPGYCRIIRVMGELVTRRISCRSKCT